MENLLFIDDEKGLKTSYNELYDFLSNKEPIICNYKGSDKIKFFRHFIKAACYSKDILLLDSNFSNEELGYLIGPRYNSDIKNIKPTKISCLKDMVEKLKNSKTNITIFTSGTTGRPKSITHKLNLLIRQVRIGDKYQKNTWGFAYNPRHMAGLQVFLQAILNQNLMIELFEKSRKSIFNSIQKYNISHISATPTFYRLLQPVEHSFANVIRISIGGERSDPNLQKKIRQLFPNAKLNNIYASTESGSLLSSKGEGFTIPKLHKQTIKIVNNELQLHSSLVGKGTELEKNNSYPWYSTGDLIEWIDKKNGFFKFSSRKNELINSGGYKINPSEVEQYILKFEDIIGAVVYGKDNSILGKIVCCDIVKKANSSIDEHTIRHFLKNKIKDYKIPRIINFIDKLNFNRTGKLKKNNE